MNRGPTDLWPLTPNHVQVRALDSLLQMVLKMVVIPTVNGKKQKKRRKVKI